MRKLVSILILIALLISLVACGQDPAMQENAQETTEAIAEATEETLPWWSDMLKDPNALDFDSIDENVPQNGQYQIHTAEGLKNIAKYPDASFIILRDIDMEGAEWTPVEKFTGKLNGQTYKIHNFTISQPTADGNLAFLGINEGTINNFYLENVTITSNEKTVNIGSIAAINKGTMRRNSASGTMIVDKAAENFVCGGAVAVNEKIIETQEGAMNIVSSVSGKGSIGGLVGIQNGGKLQICTVEGDITVTNGTNKLVGMFCGQANDVAMEDNAFAGVSRTVDGEALEVFCGAEENVTNVGWALRDYLEPLSDVVLDKRTRVVEAMNAMASVYWTVSEPLPLEFDCGCCENRTYMPGIQYRGIPYIHKNSSMTRWMELLDENNVIDDWVYELDAFDGWDIYGGNDCSTAYQQAMAVVCNDCAIIRAADQFPGMGFANALPVGDWVWDIPESEIIKVKSSKPYVEATGVEAMLECYAQVRIGDGIANRSSGGAHCRVVTADPVVMRDETGKIDPEKSYLLETDQATSHRKVPGTDYESTWNLNAKQTFAKLLEINAVPITFEELNTEEPITTPVITVEDTVDGRFGMTTGIVTSNVYLDAVTLIVTEADGTEVFNQKVYTTVDKRGHKDDQASGKSEDRYVRQMPFTYDLAFFATPLRNIVFDLNKAYNVQIIGHTNSGFDVVAREFTF